MSPSPKKLETQNSGVLSRTACFQDVEEVASGVSELEQAVYQAEIYGEAKKEMAHYGPSIFPLNRGDFASISSIASEGLNNFASVQSNQTKAMLNSMGQTLSDAEVISAAAPGSFQVQTGISSLDKILQRIMVEELFNAERNKQNMSLGINEKERILQRIHSITKQYNLDDNLGLSLLQKAARFLSSVDSFHTSKNEIEGLNQDLCFDFDDERAQKEGEELSFQGTTKSNKRRLSTLKTKPSSRAGSKNRSIIVTKTSKVSKKSKNNTPGSVKSRKVGSNKAGSGSLKSMVNVSLNTITRNANVSNDMILPGDSISIEQTIGDTSELSIKPTKLQRLDLGTLTSGQTSLSYQESKQPNSKSKRSSNSARGNAPVVGDCLLSASVYRGEDKPIPRPPNMKTINLTSLNNFSTLRSNESNSFRLARLVLDESTIEKSIEKSLKPPSEKSAKKYSPYRSSSQHDSKDKALSIVNASETQQSLRLRKFTSAKAKPLSARASTPSVPKPGLKKKQSRQGSKEKKKPVANRPPVAAPTKARPPQPGKIMNKSHKLSSVHIKNDRSLPTLPTDHIAPIDESPLLQIKKFPAKQNFAQTPDLYLQPQHSQCSQNSNQSSHRESAISSYQVDATKSDQIAPVTVHEYSSKSLKQQLKHRNHYQKKVANDSALQCYGSSSYRLNANTTMGSEMETNSNVFDQVPVRNSTQDLARSREISGFQIEEGPSLNLASENSQSEKSLLEARVMKDAAQGRVRASVQQAKIIGISSSEYVIDNNFVTFNQMSLEKANRDQQHLTNKKSMSFRSKKGSRHSSTSQTTSKQMYNYPMQHESALELQQRSHYTKALKTKVFTKLKQDLKVARQKQKLSVMFYRSRLVASVVQRWRQCKLLIKEQSQLARLKLFKIMPIFERSQNFQTLRETFMTMKKLTLLSESATDFYRLKVLKQCLLDGFMSNLINQRQKKSVMRDIDDLYGKKLLGKALHALDGNVSKKRDQNVRHEAAVQFFKERPAKRLLRNGYDALVSYVIIAKQMQNARTHHIFTLLLKSYLSLRENHVMQRKKRGQNSLVSNLYRCTLATKAFNKLNEHMLTRVRLRQNAVDEWRLKKLTRLFRKLKAFAKRGERMEVVLGVKIAKDQALMSQKVLRAMRNHVTKVAILRKVKSQVEQGSRMRHKKVHLREWASLTKKKYALKRCQKVSLQIDRERMLTKYIAKWFSALHLRLKKKHLQKIQSQFYEAKTKAKFMKVWLTSHLKSLKLIKLDKKFATKAERQTLQKTFSALNDYRKRYALKKRKNQAAQMEYIWWLGKRVFSSLRGYYLRRRTQKEMSKMVLSDWAKAVRMKCWQALKLYTKFHGERRRHDTELTCQIRAQKVKKVMLAWTSHYSQRIGARLLVQSLDQCTKRMTLLQIQRVGILQIANIAYFRAHQPNILLTWCLISLRRHARRRQYDRYVLERRKYERIGKVFDTWRKRYLFEESKITFFNKTLICIKNNIAKHAFKAIALNALRGRLNKRADVHRYFAILYKGLRSLRRHVDSRNRLSLNFNNLNQSHLRLNLATFFRNWQKRYRKKAYLTAANFAFKDKQILKIFKALDSYRKCQLQKRLFVQQAKHCLMKIRAKYCLKKFNLLSKELAQQKVASAQARRYRAERLYKSAAESWFSMFKRNHKIFGQFKRFKARKVHQSKQFSMQVWLKACGKRLNFVRAASSINKLLYKLQKKRNLQFWHIETTTLSKLEAATKKADMRIRKLRGQRALRQLNQVATVLAFKRTQLEQTAAYSDMKLLKKVFAELFIHKEERLTAAHHQVHALTFHGHNLLIKGFNALVMVHEKQVKMQQAVTILRKRQLNLYGRKILAKWQNRLNNRNKIYDQNLTAAEFNSLRLRRICLEAFHINRMNARDKYRLQDVGDKFRRRFLIDRGLRALLLYLCKRKDKQEKTSIAIEAIERIQSGSLVRQVFEALYSNLTHARQEKKLARLHYLQSLLLRSLRQLNHQSQRQKRLRATAKQVWELTKSNKIQGFYMHWREVFIFQQALGAADQKHKANLLSRCFKALHQNSQRQNKVKIVSQIHSVTQVVKAFESLKRNMLQSRSKRQLHMKAMVFRAQKLKAKVIGAFMKMLAWKLIVVEVERRQSRRVLATYFVEWDHQLSLKLMRKDAFYMFQVILKRRALRIWSHKSSLASQAEQSSHFSRKQLVSKAWQALQVTTYRSKCAKYLTKKSLNRLQQDSFRAWTAQIPPNQLKVTLLVKKLSKLFTLEAHFETIRQFSTKEKFLVEHTSDFASKVEQRTKRKVLKDWMDAFKKSKAAEVIGSIFESFDGGLAQESETSKNSQNQSTTCQTHSLNHIVSFGALEKQESQKRQSERSLPQSLAHIGAKLIKQQAFESLKHHALEQQAEQEKLYKIIDYFGHRRPQCLLRIQKTFLHINSEHSQNLRICSATLAKYVLEKWRNALPSLAQSQQRLRVAHQHHRATLLKRCINALSFYSKHKRQQACISVILNQTHEDNIARSAFTALKHHTQTSAFNSSVISQFAHRRTLTTQSTSMLAWQFYAAKKAQLRHLQYSISAEQNQKIGLRYLHRMMQVSQQSAVHQSIVNSFDTRREKILCWQVLQVLHNYAKTNQRRRMNQNLVNTFRSRILFKRVMIGFKLQHATRVSKHRYSKLFAIFTSWKTMTKENNLLKKYLAECNYKKQVMHSMTIEQMGSGKKKRDSFGEADDQEFTAGHELVFQAVGQLSFADSVMVDYRTLEAANSNQILAQQQQHLQQQQQQQQKMRMLQPQPQPQLNHSTILQQSTIEMGSEQLGLNDLYDDGINSRDNNFLFGCQPSVSNYQKRSLQKRFGGETSSDDEATTFSRY